MLNCKTKEDVIAAVNNLDVSFIQLWFTDVLGQLKSFAMTPAMLEEAMTEGLGLDGSSIEGFCRIEESDMIAMPDPTTFQILPWRPEDRPVGRMFCDILNPDGTHFVGCPRNALRRVLKKAEEMGFSNAYMGPELEFFYFASDTEPKTLDKGGYYDAVTTDRGVDLRRATVFALQKLGIPVEYSHHEVAPSQHEIALRYADAMAMADNVQAEIDARRR